MSSPIHRAIDAVWRIEAARPSPAWRASPATSGWPKSWRRTRSWSRSSAKLGRVDEARRELLRAADLARNTREQQLLLARAAALPRS